MEKIDKIKQGRKNRNLGKAFERKVKEDLEKSDWTVLRFNKNINLEKKKLEDVKPKYNPFTKSVMYTSTGFPDYFCFRQSDVFEGFFVEVKSNGYLDKEEKEKLRWLKFVFSEIKILIASKGKKRGEIVYKGFQNGTNK